MALRDVAQNFYDFFALKNKISVFLQINTPLHSLPSKYQKIIQKSDVFTQENLFQDCTPLVLGYIYALTFVPN